MKKFFVGLTQVVIFEALYTGLMLLNLFLLQGVSWVAMKVPFLGNSRLLGNVFETLVFVIVPIIIGSIIVAVISWIYKNTPIYIVAYVVIDLLIGYEVVTKIISAVQQYGVFSWNFVDWVAFHLISGGVIVVGLFSKTVYSKESDGRNNTYSSLDGMNEAVTVREENVYSDGLKIGISFVVAILVLWGAYSFFLSSPELLENEQQSSVEETVNDEDLYFDFLSLSGEYIEQVQEFAESGQEYVDLTESSSIQRIQYEDGDSYMLRSAGNCDFGHPFVLDLYCDETGLAETVVSNVIVENENDLTTTYGLIIDEAKSRFGTDSVFDGRENGSESSVLFYDGFMITVEPQRLDELSVITIAAYVDEEWEQDRDVFSYAEMSDEEENISISMQEVDSSAISRIGYSQEYKILRIEFKESEDIYDYYDVPKSAYEKLISADSIGKEYNLSIKGEYECEKIGE